MSIDLNSDQIKKLQDLGITALPQVISVPQKTSIVRNSLPLLSVSGLTLISFGGIILFKSKESNQAPVPTLPITNYQLPSPTQVPKSIQHFLLSSQQSFSSALQAQSSPGSGDVVSLLNQSILSATDAIKEFPNDYRGYQQRGRIYQTLVDSQPQLVDNAISDLITANRLNPSAADITHDIALLYAKKGDTTNTINYLQLTVNLEPTKAQNFYDLAKIQQQVGLVPQALSTYNRLLPLVTDPNQKTTIEIEQAALQKLVSQNPSIQTPTISIPTPTTPLTQPSDPTLHADLPAVVGAGASLVIAAPETQKEVSVNSLTQSNSLSGDSFLPSGQKSLTLTNSHITANSQVYLTITKGGKNQVLSVLSKSIGSAVIGFDTPLNEDVSFKWWIIE